MSRRRELWWYKTSEKLGIEITLMGVGDWTYLPGQWGTPVSFQTEDGETALWMKRSIDRPYDMPWWFHTHPNMSPFISTEDVRGAHAMWDMIKKPFRAIIVGRKDQRLEKTINERWIRRHPPTMPQQQRPQRPITQYVQHPFGHPSTYRYSSMWCHRCGGYDGQHTPTCEIPTLGPATRSYRTDQPLLFPVRSSSLLVPTPPGLRKGLTYLMQKFGAQTVYEEVDQMVTEQYADRRLARTEEENSREDSSWNW
jgi:hypothetical protein